MIFIYNCYAGTHSSSIASAVHLNELPDNRIPSEEEIFSTRYFDKLTPKDIGKIIYRGTDEEGNKLFTLGRGPSKILIPCVENLITLLHNESGLDEKIVFSNMSPTVGFATSVGGFISRRIGFKFLGKPFLTMGVKKSYMRVVELVNKTKKASKEMTGNVLVLENKKT